MAKNSNKNKKTETTADYYNLKTEAVDKLVNAKDAPEVSEAEIRKYTSKGKFYIPSWLKILFVKFWFSGAICYFFLWGLGLYLQNLDLMVALAIGLGLVTDLMVNHVLHTFEPTPGAYDKWMMVPFRKFWTLFVNIIYAGVLLFCVMQAYNVINTVLVGDVSTAESVAVGVEPLLFGLLYMGFDMLFITIKNTFVKIFRDAEKKVSGNK
ncbi:MAG: hypothetical protein HDT43_02370 [Ruminococcaceae bacterium]|nr:hypothetical protein [Oscillospiraceae bacterium]